jgi:hypothetical protein
MFLGDLIFNSKSLHNIIYINNECTKHNTNHILYYYMYNNLINI